VRCSARQPRCDPGRGPRSESHDARRRARPEAFQLERAFEIVGQLRGVGLLWGIEIIRDADSRDEAPELAAAVTVEAMERGLIVGGLRPGIREANVLRLAPPLVIGEEQVERAVSILAEALTTMQAGTRA
jgi:4-aminobutyrate aminotransferase